VTQETGGGCGGSANRCPKKKMREKKKRGGIAYSKEGGENRRGEWTGGGLRGPRVRHLGSMTKRGRGSKKGLPAKRGKKEGGKGGGGGSEIRKGSGITERNQTLVGSERRRECRKERRGDMTKPGFRRNGRLTLSKIFKKGAR